MVENQDTSSRSQMRRAERQARRMQRTMLGRGGTPASPKKHEVVVRYVDPHHFQTNDIAWAQCSDGLWHRVSIVRSEMKQETLKPKSSGSSSGGTHVVEYTQYRARWRPGGRNAEVVGGVFAQMKRKLLPHNAETLKWLFQDVGLENVAEDDRCVLSGVNVTPMGWYPGTEKVERRRAPF